MGHGPMLFFFLQKLHNATHLPIENPNKTKDKGSRKNYEGGDGARDRQVDHSSDGDGDEIEPTILLSLNAFNEKEM